jgi:Argonaute siRNA chaperone (ARC) complex subunit Arb1
MFQVIILKDADPEMAKQKATGFEEYHIEGPTRPQEYDEGCDVYNLNFTPAERLEVAIQRYFRKRKFTNKRRVALDHFLFFGGIENRCRLFTRQDKQDLKNMDKEDRDLATAVHFIDKEKQNPSYWELDFLGVAQAYFSSWYPQSFDYSEEGVNFVCSVVVNFYNYLLYHNVCAEEAIRNDILSARSLVQNQVQKELLSVKQVGLNLPGAFNQACELLFSAATMSTSRIANMNQTKAVVENGITALGFDKMVAFVKDPNWVQKVTVEREFRALLEVTTIKQARVVGNGTSNDNGTCLGSLTCKPLNVNDFAAIDMPKEQLHTWELPNVVDIWLEDRALEHCFTGMKLMSHIRLLRFGNGSMLWTIGDDVMALCSFYRFVLNELDDKLANNVETFTESEIDGAQDTANNSESYDSDDPSEDEQGSWSIMDSGRLIDEASI